MKKIIFTLMLLMISLASFASAALQAVGPNDPNDGFPNWYQDSNGLAIEKCLETTGFCLLDPAFDLPAPASPVSFPDNYPPEIFWWTSDADVAFPGGGSGLLVLAMEGAFAGEQAIPGEQSTFGRVRIRLDVPETGTYTVTHPFGTNTYNVASVGPGPEVFDTSDIGCLATPPVVTCANSFNIALQSGIGPFLTWDTFNLNPALTDPQLVNPANPTARYVGDPAIAHTITGSPTGNNVFRVIGPSAASTAETNLFLVSGKVAVIDITAPVVGATSPTQVTQGATNVGATVQITDDLGVAQTNGVKIDLGPLGNSLSATLDGVQAGTSSPATGTGTFTIDTTANTLTFDISYSGLLGVETAAHIHGPDGINPDAVLFTLPTTAGTKTGTWNYPEASEVDILSGNTYVNIHTNAPVPVEIRGQILSLPNVQNMNLIIGTKISGTWFRNILGPLDRVGTFNLPLFVTDGSNVVNTNFVLNVVSPLASVSATPATAILIEGGGIQQLTASPLGQDGLPFVGATITWSSSNPLVASVNADTGLVTAVAPANPTTPGTATITATATFQGTSVTGNSVITVTPTPVLTSVSISPVSVSITPGSTQQLSASSLDQFGNSFAGATITWTSSNSLVASVNLNTGLATAVAPGNAVITATATSGATIVTSPRTVSVPVPILTGVSIAPPLTTTVIVGNTQQLTTSSVVDQTGAPFAGATITWTSSNSLIASVNLNTGLVTAVAPGDVTITATATSGATSVSSTSSLTIIPVPILTNVDLSQTAVSIVSGGVKQITAVPKDQGGNNFTGATVTWSSSNISVATVNANGLVTIVAPGNAVITATASDGAIPTPVTAASSATITVADPARIELTPLTTSVTVSGTRQLTLTAFDVAGNALEGTTATWTSSDSLVASVDANGLVTGVALGDVTITATRGLLPPVSATITVEQLVSVGVTPGIASINTGATQQLTASPIDQTGNSFVGATITWVSSDGAIATVDANGLVTALSPGSITINVTATSGTAVVSSTSSLTVSAPAPSGGSSSGGGGGGGGSSGGSSSRGVVSTLQTSQPEPEQFSSGGILEGTIDLESSEDVQSTESSRRSGITGAILGAFDSPGNIVFVGASIATIVVGFSLVHFLRKR